MGQYYKACFKKENGRTFKAISPYDWGNGAKLMEHSYFGNDYVNAVLCIIASQPHHIIWAGDYADNIEGKGNNLYFLATMYDKAKHKKYLSSIGGISDKKYQYLCNHTKKVFVNLDNATKDENGWTICPLCLLTADGNGRGVGDYIGSDMDSVSAWSGDLISLEEDVPEGYTEEIHDFKEKW